MPVGRPTEYSEEIVLKSKEYINSCVDEIENYHKTQGDKSNSYERIVNVKIPTIEGLAVYLKIGRTTVYEWIDKFPEFECIIEELRATQADRLLNNGLSGNYNATIAKVLLTKHGYKEDFQTYDRITGNEIIFRDMSSREAV